MKAIWTSRRRHVHANDVVWCNNNCRIHFLLVKRWKLTATLITNALWWHAVMIIQDWSRVLCFWIVPSATAAWNVRGVVPIYSTKFLTVSTNLVYPSLQTCGPSFQTKPKKKSLYAHLQHQILPITQSLLLSRHVVFLFRKKKRNLRIDSIIIVADCARILKASTSGLSFLTRGWLER